MEKRLNYYLNLPWTFRFEWDSGDNIYIARIAELKYCTSHGGTIEEAAHNIREALEQHLEVMLEDNIAIPEPPKIEDYKGKIAYRTSPKLHYEIAKKAASEGKSISKFLDEIIEKEVA